MYFRPDFEKVVNGFCDFFQNLCLLQTVSRKINFQNPLKKNKIIMEIPEFKQTEEQTPVYDKALYRKRRNFSLSLLIIFSAVYFFAAVLTTSEFKEIAALDIFGLPFAFYIGTFVFMLGVVITRIYLIKNK